MRDRMDADRHAGRARRLYEAGRLHEALSELRFAIANDPGQAHLYVGLGLTLDRLDRHDEAVIGFENALRLDPAYQEAMLALAGTLVHCGRYREAIEQLQAVTRLDPHCEHAYCLGVLAHARLGEHDLAEQMFYLSQQLTEDCPDCFDHIAQSLVARGQYDRAIWCWQQVLRLDPRHGTALGQLGRVFWNQGRLDLARQYLLMQSQQDPGDLDCAIDMGVLSFETGRRADAERQFHRVLLMEPGCAEAHLYLGRLSLAAGSTQVAKVRMETAAQFDSSLPGVHLGFAAVALAVGQTKVARAHLLAECRSDGLRPSQAVDLSRGLLKVGAHERVIELATRVLGGSGATPMTVTQRAKLLKYRARAQQRLGRTAGAGRDYRRAVRLVPDEVAVMIEAAGACNEAGGFLRAGVWLRRARRVRPRDPRVKALARRVWPRLMLRRVGR